MRSRVVFRTFTVTGCSVIEADTTVRRNIAGGSDEHDITFGPRALIGCLWLAVCVPAAGEDVESDTSAVTCDVFRTVS